MSGYVPNILDQLFLIQSKRSGISPNNGLTHVSSETLFEIIGALMLHEKVRQFIYQVLTVDHLIGMSALLNNDDVRSQAGDLIIAICLAFLTLEPTLQGMLIEAKSLLALDSYLRTRDFFFFPTSFSALRRRLRKSIALKIFSLIFVHPQYTFARQMGFACIARYTKPDANYNLSFKGESLNKIRILRTFPFFVHSHSYFFGFQNYHY